MNQVVVIGIIREFDGCWKLEHEDFGAHPISLLGDAHMLGHFQDGMMAGVKGILKLSGEGIPYICVQHVAMIGR